MHTKCFSENTKGGGLPGELDVGKIVLNERSVIRITFIWLMQVLMNSIMNFRMP
jgi:hypothetical protein